MKKRKILLLIPFAGLILSGCSAQDGFGWIGQNIFTPIKDFFSGLFNPGGKQEDQKKEDEGGGGGGGDEDKPTEDQPEHAGTLADPFTGKDACIVANKLGAGNTSEVRYYIQGTVQSFSEKSNDQFNPNYGSYTFFIEDGFECYRCLKGEAKAKYSTGEELKVGDTVLVNAFIKQFYETSETDDGYILKINGVEQTTEESSEPAKINATLAEILATEGSKSQAYVSSATIKSWADNKGVETDTVSEYGNMIITDGEHDVFVYGASGVAEDLKWDAVNNEYKMSNSKVFKINDLTKDLKPGDTINFWGIYFVFTSGNVSTPEMNIIITGSTPAVPADPETIVITSSNTVSMGDTLTLKATVGPVGAPQDVEWDIVSGGDRATLQGGVLTPVSAGEVVVKATAVGFESVTAQQTITITSSESITEETVLPNQGTAVDGGTNGADWTVTGKKVVISGKGTLTADQMRLFKGKTMTISSDSKTITSIEFTCTANGTTKQGPGCFGAGAPEGYTYEATGNKGTWVGSASSVSFTATDNQVRITQVVITYAA